MPPILEQEPAVNWSEDHKRRPEAHAGNPAATAEQIPFAWKKDAGVDGAAGPVRADDSRQRGRRAQRLDPGVRVAEGARPIGNGPAPAGPPT